MGWGIVQEQMDQFCNHKYCMQLLKKIASLLQEQNIRAISNR